MVNRIVLIFLFVFAALLAVPTGVSAALTQQQYLGLIELRCEATKQLIDERRRSDLVARINKGRAYQTIIDQQNAFSLRLRNNRVPADSFDRQVTVVQDGVNRFRTAYNRYDDSVANLLDIDCKTNPQQFAEQLQLARSLRQIIGNEVAAIDTELAKYRQTVADFKGEIERLNNTVLGESQ